MSRWEACIAVGQEARVCRTQGDGETAEEEEEWEVVLM